MTIRRKVEEVDPDGRRSVTIHEEPVMERMASNDETISEERLERSGGWNLTRGFIRTFGLWVLAALAAVETLLGFRLGFLLAGANPANGFVDFIYDISGPLADPFSGIASNRAVDGGVFEWASLIAMIVYAVAAMLLIAVLWAMTAFPSRTGERSAVTRTRHHERTAHQH